MKSKGGNLDSVSEWFEDTLGMNRKKWLVFGVAAVVLLVIFGSIAVYRHVTSSTPDVITQEAVTSSFGVTYVPVRGQQAANLGVSSGALVTEVAPGSPADRAGVKVNDVILSFNGASVENGVPLYGMMSSCPMGGAAQMEVLRGQMVKSITLVKSAW